MIAPPTFSRLWRRFALYLRTMRQMPKPLHVPASTAVGVNQFQKSGRGDSDGDTGLSILVVNETRVEFNVSVEVERDRMRIWIRDV